MNGKESCLDFDVEQPPVWEHTASDGIFIKQMYLKKAGTLVPQHAHEYAHTTMLAKGSLRVWKEGVLLGDFIAPSPIYIEAKKKHKLLSLEHDTLAYCIHNVSRSGQVEINEKNEVA